MPAAAEAARSAGLGPALGAEAATAAWGPPGCPHEAAGWGRQGRGSTLLSTASALVRGLAELGGSSRRGARAGR